MSLSRNLITPIVALACALLVQTDSARADTEINLSAAPKRTLVFTGLIGGSIRPAYPGASDFRPGGNASFGFLSFRSPTLDFGDIENAGADPFARRKRFAAGLAFGYEAARKSDDFSELDGLDDVDASLELGVGIRYAVSDFEFLATARYGLTGHESFVGDVRAYYVFSPMDRVVVRAGPRIEWGSDDYLGTYFGVSEREAARSDFSEFDPSGGLISAGLDVIATYEIADDWWLEARARWDRLQDDAADSPITRQGSIDQTEFRLGVRRAFRLSF